MPKWSPNFVEQNFQTFSRTFLRFFSVRNFKHESKLLHREHKLAIFGVQPFGLIGEQHLLGPTITTRLQLKYVGLSPLSLSIKAIQFNWITRRYWSGLCLFSPFCLFYSLTGTCHTFYSRSTADLFLVLSHDTLNLAPRDCSDGCKVSDAQICHYARAHLPIQLQLGPPAPP